MSISHHMTGNGNGLRTLVANITGHDPPRPSMDVKVNYQFSQPQRRLPRHTRRARTLPGLFALRPTGILQSCRSRSPTAQSSRWPPVILRTLLGLTVTTEMSLKSTPV
jgi:hypothetical protein